jgi:ubiquinone/menaquinone biosynthesis C-methylase UbiE
MIARARERCAGLTNVRLEVSSGRDLAGLADSSLDLVLAADVFPYLVQAGSEVASRHVAEAARVLRPGGTLAILNYSYRGDIEADQRELAAFADASGFASIEEPRPAFRYWDGAVFLLRKAG